MTLKKDSNPNKINLAVGVFKDEQGNHTILKSRKNKQRRAFVGWKKKPKVISVSKAHQAYRIRRAKTLYCNDHPIITKASLLKQLTPLAHSALRAQQNSFKKPFA